MARKKKRSGANALTVIALPWVAFTKAMLELSELEIGKALSLELSRESPRPNYLLRLYERYSKLRRTRERAEIAKRIAERV